MTKKTLGYPYTYGDQLTLEMACNNRKTVHNTDTFLQLNGLFF